MMVSKRFFLSRSKLFGFLEELEASDISGSLYLPSGLPGEEAAESIGRIATLQAVPEELAGLAAASKTGAVVFWGRERTYLVLPPFLWRLWISPVPTLLVTRLSPRQRPTA